MISSRPSRRNSSRPQAAWARRKVANTPVILVLLLLLLLLMLPHLFLHLLHDVEVRVHLPCHTGHVTGDKVPAGEGVVWKDRVWFGVDASLVWRHRSVVWSD